MQIIEMQHDSLECPLSRHRSATVLDLSVSVDDALGAPVEFCRPGSLEPVTGDRPGGAFDLEAGQWTDDSSMALSTTP
jgi:ADP-ribosylglycohydrolase